MISCTQCCMYNIYIYIIYINIIKYIIICTYIHVCSNNDVMSCHFLFPSIKPAYQSDLGLTRGIAGPHLWQRVPPHPADGWIGFVGKKLTPKPRWMHGKIRKHRWENRFEDFPLKTIIHWQEDLEDSLLNLFRTHNKSGISMGYPHNRWFGIGRSYEKKGMI